MAELRDWVITIHTSEMTPAEAEAVFDRVADAAHALDEAVTCSMGPDE